MVIMDPGIEGFNRTEMASTLYFGFHLGKQWQGDGGGGKKNRGRSFIVFLGPATRTDANPFLPEREL